MIIMKLQNKNWMIFISLDDFKEFSDDLKEAVKMGVIDAL